MPEPLANQRRIARTPIGRAFAVALCLALAGGTGCAPNPIDLEAGLPEFQELAALTVPGGGRVNVIGGNLLLARTDLTIDTQLGAFSVGATWNSATREWRWSFDGIKVASGVLTDESGYAMNFGALPNGAAVAGTQWVRVNLNACGALQIKTKGGLQHDFRCDGRQLSMHWSSSYEPYLRWRHELVGDGRLRTTAIEQCLAAGGGCHPVYDFAYDASGRVSSITDRAGRTALSSYDASGRLVQARDGLDVAKGWPGARYEYAANGDLTSVTNSEGERVEFEYAQGRRVSKVRQVGLENPVHQFYYEGKNANTGLYVTRFADPLGNEVRFRYDADRMLREVESMGTGEKVTRAWSNRRVTALTLPDGVTTTWSYASDDVATRIDPSGNVTTFTYQPNGVNRDDPRRRAVLAIADSIGPVESRSYDGSGRLVAVTNGAGETTAFTYGSHEMIATRTLPTGLIWSYEDYGVHGHATSVTPPGQGDPVVLGYDAVGNRRMGDLLEREPEWGASLRESTTPTATSLRSSSPISTRSSARTSTSRSASRSSTAVIGAKPRSGGRPAPITSSTTTRSAGR